MHDAGRPIQEAHIERPSPRRDTLALGISFVIHALTVLLVVLFWNGTVGGAPAETTATADVILEETARPPSQQPSPLPTHTAVPTPPPRVVVRPIPRRRRASNSIC